MDTGPRIAFIGEETVQVLSAYLVQQELDVKQVVSLAGGGHRLSGTPTIVLVGRDGLVLGAWVGRLDAIRESEVLAAMR